MGAGERKTGKEIVSEKRGVVEGGKWEVGLLCFWGGGGGEGGSCVATISTIIDRFIQKEA